MLTHQQLVSRGQSGRQQCHRIVLVRPERRLMVKRLFRVLVHGDVDVLAFGAAAVRSCAENKLTGANATAAGGNDREQAAERAWAAGRCVAANNDAARPPKRRPASDDAQPSRDFPTFPNSCAHSRASDGLARNAAIRSCACGLTGALRARLAAVLLRVAALYIRGSSDQKQRPLHTFEGRFTTQRMPICWAAM